MTNRFTSSNKSPIVTARLAITCQEALLFVQRNPETAKSLGGYWEFPGGKVDPLDDLEALLLGVSTYALAATREVGEEIGHDIDPREVGRFARFKDLIHEDGVRAIGHIASANLDTFPELSLSNEVSMARWLLPTELAVFISKGNLIRPDTVHLAHAFEQAAGKGMQLVR